MVLKAPSLAKTARPKLPEVFPRRRLFRLMDRGRKRPILWVTGPPGSGKTTLVASYLDARKVSPLWYQVDEADADVARFFYCMGLAAKRAAPRHRNPLPLLTPEYRAGLSAFTRRYFQELYGRLRSPFTVVFDNYERAPSDSPFHDAIRDGLGEIPREGRIIVISRSDPPPGLARLRASHAVELVGWEALRLTRQESDGIARLQRPKRLTREMLGRLHERTEGWAAGLVLMLERAETEWAPPESRGEFASETVFDYFASEILQNEDPEIQDFLLKTAFLSRMTAHMAADLAGVRHAGRILSGLNRSNYFTERRRLPEPVYQYHPLFREFLMTRAKTTFTVAQLAQLRSRAAALLAANEQVEDAVVLLKDAGDPEALARLILQEAPSLMAQGEILTLQQWLGALPQEMIGRNAWLLYWLGASHLPFSPAQSRRYFERAFHLFHSRQNYTGIFQAWCGVVESVLFEWGDFTLLDRWIARLEELLRRRATFSSPEIQARVTCCMFGALMFRQPQHPEISAWARRTLVLARDSADVSQRTLNGAYLAHYYFWMGDLATAGKIIDALRESARLAEATPASLLHLKFVEAVDYWHMALADPCLKAVSQGLERAQATGVRLWDVQLLAQGVYGSLSAGDLTAAGEFLQRMASALDESRRLDVGHYHFLRAWHALLQKDLSRAFRHVQISLELAIEAGTRFPEALNHLAMAQILHDRGEHRMARDHLAKARRIGREINSLMLRFMGLLAEAQFALGRAEAAKGVKFLRRAMALGKEQGYVNTPWWRPSVMTGLCAKALEEGIEVEYVQDLVCRRDLFPDSPPLEIDHWPWPLRIFSLGKFRIVKRERPVQFSRKVQQKPLATLKALIAFGGREVPEEQLLDALWPQAEGDVAHQAFATTLHRLRRLLGHDKAVLLQGGQVTLDARYCWVDTWAFERLLGRADQVEASGQTDEALALIGKALGLYGGPFLSGEGNEAWVISLRERLRTKFIRYTGKQGSHWERAGKWQRAVECYERGLEVEDLAEQLYQRLMFCYQCQGRRAEALAVYERCRRTLTAALGVDPSPETEALHRSLRPQ